jgi:ribonuclease P protein component
LAGPEKETFNKADRIRKRSEFLRLNREGKKVQNRHFIIFYAPGRRYRTRLGITVARKVGGAVTRNRIKRIAREYFRKNRDQLKGVWDINLIAKKEVANLPAETINNAIEKLFKKLSDC